jgi:isopentenyldiphosphate isomerase
VVLKGRMTMKNEYLDIFDEEMKHIGVEIRQEVHEKGFWHQTFHCWVIQREEGRTHLLFQRRHPSKDTFPNMLDVTAAGHLEAGETPQEGIRELEEELGISVSSNALHYIGVIKSNIEGQGFIDRELQHVHKLEHNQPLEEFCLQEDEVIGLYKIEFEEAVQLFLHRAPEAEIDGIALTKNGVVKEKRKVTMEDFAPAEDEYYIRLFQGIKDYVAEIR